MLHFLVKTVWLSALLTVLMQASQAQDWPPSALTVPAVPTADDFAANPEPSPAASPTVTVPETPLPVQPLNSPAMPSPDTATDYMTIDPNAPTVLPEPGDYDWTKELVNDAVWTAEDTEQKWPTPSILRAQILLMQNQVSPGALDGMYGKNMLKAISAFEYMNQLPVDGKMDQQVWDLLVQKQKTPVLVDYVISEKDVNYPFVESIPEDYALQAKMKVLDYTSITEMLGERFKFSQRFLKKLNSQATWFMGETIMVPDFGPEDLRPIARLIAIKKASQLYAFDDKAVMIATFPATVGSEDTPSPTGDFTIANIGLNPPYRYDPLNFIQGENMSVLILPSGANNPVGLVWMGLSKPSYGIHGNPNPEFISKNSSHGCVRVANWDALHIAKRIKKGVQVNLR